MNKLRINWTNTLFLILVPIVAVAGTTALLLAHAVHWPTWLLAGGMVLMSGFGITGGYHRLYAHGSYQAHWLVRLIFALFGAAAFEGSILEWCTDHRNHHRYTDTEKDPYNIKQGFWYAHIGWLFTLDTTRRDFNNVTDLMQDPIVRFQHKFFVPLAIIMGFLLPMAIGALWGNALAGLIIAGALRICVVQHFTFCINSVCHVFGKRTYTEQSARDNWLTAFFTFGEGYHNFHHQFPIDYRNGVRFYHFDPTKWLIYFLSSCKLAKNLKRVSQQRMVHYRIRLDYTFIQNQMNNILKLTHENLMQLLNRIEELEKSYEQLKKAKQEYLVGKMHEYRARIIEYRASLKQYRKELKHSLSVWARLISQVRSGKMSSQRLSSRA